MRISTPFFFSLAGASAAALSVSLFLTAAEPEYPQPRASSAMSECVGLLASRPDYFDEDKLKRARARWVEVCEHAYAEEPDNPRVMFSLASALPAATERTVDLLRKAAAKGDPDALRDIYETFKSFGRRDLSHPTAISRAEAEAALRKAAELGDRTSIHILTVLLDRGATVKRDAAEARIWAQRLHANPPT